MQLELRHIRCFVSVARHLHFSKAAEELGIAPPSLTRQIQEAERLLGFRLFLRTKRSVALTAAGEAYLVAALAALDHLAQGEEIARAAERGELGRIEVGYVASAAYTGVLQETVRQYRREHPRIEVNAREIVMDQVAELLGNGKIDVAYVRPPMHFPEHVQAVTVHRDTFILALPIDSALIASASVSPHQLHDATFVLPEQESGTLEVGRRGRFSPKLGQRPGTLAAVLACVSLGGAVAVVPSALADCVDLPGVEFRPISGKPIVSEVALVFRRHERAPAIRAFVRNAKRS
ncbi:LysR family transcriptional regulator [Pararobbsia alpina]|uniref:Hca operon transcriptional activator HcaR n=1 Tax=Pararobbsia alpina TaxID=621374 RepID=A0A6S7BEV9_9BURK|nr:LysR family transcriptional regulator [Pararobbsia alpina]CAB3798082.1 Hca operon transcriptional activator HcaR [Pararobbsia alpina]